MKLVVNCIAISELPRCAENPQEAQRLNVEFPREIAQLCKKRKIPFLHISSDGLFPNGKSAPAYWSIEDQTAPVSLYGKTKRDAEIAIQSVGWGHCIRLSFIGEGLGTTRGLLTFIANKLARKENSIPGFTDVWFTPCHVEDVAERIIGEYVEETPAQPFSVHHWSTYPALTKFEFVRLVCAKAGFSAEVQPIQRATMLPEAPLDQSLKSDSPWTQEALIEKSARSLLAEIKGLQP